MIIQKKPVFATRRRNFVLITLECMLCSKHNSNAIWFTFEINVFVYVDLLLFCFRLIQVSDAFVYQLMNEEMILVFSNDLQSIASIWLCVCVFFCIMAECPVCDILLKCYLEMFDSHLRISLIDICPTLNCGGKCVDVEIHRKSRISIIFVSFFLFISYIILSVDLWI